MFRTRRRFPLTVSSLLFASAVLLSALARGQAVAPPEPVKAIQTAPNANGNSAALALDRRIITEAETAPEIMDNLTYLSDMIGARLTGSTALKRANEWAADKMRSYGLENVRQEAWSIPATWERGPATGRILEPNNGRSLTLASNGWTAGTHGKIVGDVVIVNATKKEELEPYRGKLKGAIVLAGKPQDLKDFGNPDRASRLWSNPNERRRGPGGPGAPGAPASNAQAARPGQGGDNGRGFGRGDFSQRMAFFRELNDFYSKEGVAIVLRDAGKPQGLLTTTGGWRDEERPNAAEPVASAHVAHEHYALLYRLATRKPEGPTKVEIDIENKLTPGPFPVWNTIGEIRGREKPDEVVILGAHLDSWDLAEGTTDNGTGSCVVLEAARILGKLAKEGIQPKRTIRFILFTGEEEGLKGSAAYVKQHKDELGKVSLCLVHDTGTAPVKGIGLQGREVIKPIFERELASLKGLGVEEFSMAGMGGSDHASFDRAGVPGFAVMQDMSQYGYSHHSQSDTLDKADPKGLIQGVKVMALTAMRVANLDSLLPRDKPQRQGPGRDPGPRAALGQ